MPAVRMYGFLLAALAAPSVALAQASDPGAPAAVPPPSPLPPPPEPAPPPPSPPEVPPNATEGAPVGGTPPPPPEPEVAVPPTGAPPEHHPVTTFTVSAPTDAEPPKHSFARNYEALPLTLEARFGFNARLGSSFDAAANEELLASNFAVAAYLAWNAEYALGLELEHSGLGRARALSGQNSIDAQYSATGGWLAARVFPVRRERLDLFINLRIGLAMQHVDALGTRLNSPGFTVPATSFSCSEWDGPGVGLGGAIGLAYRLSHHVSLVSRLDATGQRLSGDQLGSCADGIGSVASVSGSVGLAYEFETAPK